MRDAFLNAFDEAAVLTNDTDLIEPVRIVTREVGLPVTLLTPVNQASIGLKNVATRVRHIAPYLGPCLFADPVQLPGGKSVAKPERW